MTAAPNHNHALSFRSPACMRSLPLILVYSAIASTCWSKDLPIKVAKSESVKVDSLVLKLVSRRPAPYPTGYIIGPEIYITPEVDAAMQKLSHMGPQIFPALIRHLRDDRYSYSCELQGWMNRSVGDAVRDVLSEGANCPYQYLSRATPSGHSRCPRFEDYLRERQPEKWAEWAKNKTRLDIQVDFLEWCFDKEKKQGFVDDTQRKEISEKYEEALNAAGNEQKNHIRK